jgi:flavin-dependent dehydrogenase
LPVDSSHAFREIIEVDYEIERPEYIRIYMDAIIAPGGYWWLFPKGRRIMNIGLGIWGKLSEEAGLNPRHNYEKYLLNTNYTRGRRLVHVGGGIVPTRRPLISMVGNGFLAVGDAAVAVNPIHGGGIGPALLSAELASRAVVSAFERGDFSSEGLWIYNLDYLREYGIKQAKLDILRLMLQTLSNDELNRGLRARLLTEDEVLEISQRGAAALTMGMKLRILTKLLTMPRIAGKLRLALRYMELIEQVYSRYPRRPRGIEEWVKHLSSVYREYASRLGLGYVINH